MKNSRESYCINEVWNKYYSDIVHGNSVVLDGLLSHEKRQHGVNVVHPCKVEIKEYSHGEVKK